MDRLAKCLIDLRRHLLGREDEAIDVAAEPHREQPERPLVALGGRGRGREAVDGELLDGLAVDVLDPAGVEIGRQRLLGGHSHDIEPQRLAAALLDAENGLRRVVEDKSLRRHEGERKPRMQEAAATHKSFARVFAVRYAVNRGEIGAPVAFAHSRRAELARAGLGVPHTLGRCRMRGQEVGRAVVDLPLGRRLDLGVAPHRGEEPRGAIGVVSGAGRDADADAVGLEFLGAREGRERELGLRERHRPHVRIAPQIVEDAAHKRHRARLVLAHLGVLRDHVRHLVGQHRRQFG